MRKTGGIRLFGIGLAMSVFSVTGSAQGRPAEEYNFGSIYPNVAKGTSGDYCSVLGSNSSVAFDAPGGVTLISGLTIWNTATPNNVTQYSFYYGTAVLSSADSTITFDVKINHDYPLRTIYVNNFTKTIGVLGNVYLRFVAKIADCSVPIVALYHATARP